MIFIFPLVRRSIKIHRLNFFFRSTGRELVFCVSVRWIYSNSSRGCCYFAVRGRGFRFIATQRRNSVGELARRGKSRSLACCLSFSFFASHLLKDRIARARRWLQTVGPPPRRWQHPVGNLFSRRSLPYTCPCETQICPFAHMELIFWKIYAHSWCIKLRVLFIYNLHPLLLIDCS